MRGCSTRCSARPWWPSTQMTWTRSSVCGPVTPGWSRADVERLARTATLGEKQDAFVLAALNGKGEAPRRNSSEPEFGTGIGERDSQKRCCDGQTGANLLCMPGGT